MMLDSNLYLAFANTNVAYGYIFENITHFSVDTLIP